MLRLSIPLGTAPPLDRCVSTRIPVLFDFRPLAKLALPSQIAKTAQTWAIGLLIIFERRGSRKLDSLIALHFDFLEELRSLLITILCGQAEVVTCFPNVH